MTSKALRKLAGIGLFLGFLLPIWSCASVVPPINSANHAMTQLSVFVHVFEGDPALDHKIVGARVTLDLPGGAEQVTDGAGNALFTISVPNDRNDTIGYAIKVTVKADGYVENSIATNAFHGRTTDVNVSLVRAIPPVVPIHREGNRFLTPDGKEWKWKGTTDFLLYAKYLAGGEGAIQPLLQQRVAAGANLVRVFAMCANIAHFYPAEVAGYWDRLQPFVRYLASQGLYVEFTVFADAELVMPDTSVQLAHWQGFMRIVNEPNVFLELVNENSHAGNTIKTDLFMRLDGSALQSHGSEQSDMHPVEPAWDYAAYHARRDAPPDARGATNFDASEFEAVYPQPLPKLSDEGIKTTDAGFAALMGKHANIHNGGTFHSQSGVTSNLWNDAEFSAATAFFKEIR